MRLRRSRTLLLQIRPDKLHELVRVLGCDVAYHLRYGETLSLANWLHGSAPAGAALVTEGLAHLVEVLSARSDGRWLALGLLERPADWVR